MDTYIHTYYHIEVLDWAKENKKDNPLRDLWEKLESYLPKGEKNEDGEDNAWDRFSHFKKTEYILSDETSVIVNFSETRHYACENWIPELRIEITNPPDTLLDTIDDMIEDDQRIDI